MTLPDHSWSNRYVGLPYAELGRARTGADCYGLVQIIYREELSIGLPDYLGYVGVQEHGEIAALIDGAAKLPMWLPVRGVALAFDVAVFRRGRLQTHLGVVIRRGLMIHMVEGDCAKLEDYTRAPWRHRLSGLWRHVDVVGAAR